MKKVGIINWLIISVIGLGFSRAFADDTVLNAPPPGADSGVTVSAAELSPEDRDQAALRKIFDAALSVEAYRKGKLTEKEGGQAWVKTKNYNRSGRDMKAYRGRLDFFNPFGEKLLSFKVEGYDLDSDDKSRETYSCNDASPEGRKAFLKMDLDLKCVWVPEAYVFGDGTGWEMKAGKVVSSVFKD